MSEIQAVEKLTPAQAMRRELANMKDQFKAVLPPHVTPEKFLRIVYTGLSTNPDLVNCGVHKVLGACMKAAQAGLLPDGRESALIPYGSEVVFIPMIAGFMRLARQSGEIATWDLDVVCQNDHFEYERGDSPRIVHRPALRDRGPVIGAYSIVTLRSGEKSREFMDIDQLNAIKNRQREKKGGPWVTDFDEMAKKTVAKRHFKRLPSSTDRDEADRIQSAISADNEIYQEAQPTETRLLEEQAKPEKRSRLQTIVDVATEKESL